MNVHLLDGTYELFRHYYALPKSQNPAGEEIAAVRGVVRSVLNMLEQGVTHLAVATDHVIESFRNALWPGYKDGSGIEPDLWAQFRPAEDALRALGVTVWPMTEFEADDALASGAAIAARDDRVERVLICTPDKDLAQCVQGDHVIQFDRRQRKLMTEEDIVAKFGVRPASIPDWLALTGDSADGFPGIPGWGRKSASIVLARYGYIHTIPDDPTAWDVDVRGAARLAESLRAHREEALLFRRLATLRRDAPVGDSVDALAWRGPPEGFEAWAGRLGAPELADRVRELARSPGGRRQADTTYSAPSPHLVRGDRS